MLVDHLSALSCSIRPLIYARCPQRGLRADALRVLNNCRYTYLLKKINGPHRVRVQLGRTPSAAAAAASHDDCDPYREPSRLLQTKSSYISYLDDFQFTSISGRVGTAARPEYYCRTGEKAFHSAPDGRRQRVNAPISSPKCDAAGALSPGTVSTTQPPVSVACKLLLINVSSLPNYPPESYHPFLRLCKI